MSGLPIKDFMNGLFRGVYDGKQSLNPLPEKSDSIPKPQDTKADKLWAWRFGFLIGTLLQIIMLIVLVRFGVTTIGGA